MVIVCSGCGSDFEAKRSTAKYCSATCRTRGNRGAGKASTEAPTFDTGFVDQTESQLASLGKVDTVEGQQALLIARRMCSPFETGSAIASLSKEHSRLMGLLARGARTVDPVQAAKDEVARKRAERNAG